MAKLNINGKTLDVNAEPDTPLLWAIREQLGLTGTKYGCGVAQCGARTVYVDGEPVRSCSLPIGAVGASQKIITIEGASGKIVEAVQKAWLEHDVPQCGYCQSGQILAAASLIKAKLTPSDEDINREMSNICRCGTYNRIRTAIKQAAAAVRGA